MSPRGRAEALPAPFQLQFPQPAAPQGFHSRGERQLRPAERHRRGTGTISRPGLTMTSDNTSATEPFASGRGIAGTGMWPG